MDINAFPTLIRVEENVITEDDINLIISNIINFNMKSHKLLNGSSTSSHNTSFNILDYHKPIKNILLNYVLQYSKDSGIAVKDIDNSWINIQNKGSKLKKHSHPMSAISGALYLNKDADASNIYFYNPNPFIFNTRIDADNITSYSFEYITVIAPKASLILFPSWLQHDSQDINNMDNRIVLSFNAR